MHTCDSGAIVHIREVALDLWVRSATDGCMYDHLAFGSENPVVVQRDNPVAVLGCFSVGSIG